MSTEFAALLRALSIDAHRSDQLLGAGIVRAPLVRHLDDTTGVEAMILEGAVAHPITTRVAHDPAPPPLVVKR